MSKDILRCENCQYYNYDSSTVTSECNQYDNMTEDEAEKYYTNGEFGCPYCKVYEF